MCMAAVNLLSLLNGFNCPNIGEYPFISGEFIASKQYYNRFGDTMMPLRRHSHFTFTCGVRNATFCQNQNRSDCPFVFSIDWLFIRVCTNWCLLHFACSLRFSNRRWCRIRTRQQPVRAAATARLKSKRHRIMTVCSASECQSVGWGAPPTLTPPSPPLCCEFNFSDVCESVGVRFVCGVCESIWQFCTRLKMCQI